MGSKSFTFEELDEMLRELYILSEQRSYKPHLFDEIIDYASKLHAKESDNNKQRAKCSNNNDGVVL